MVKILKRRGRSLFFDDGFCEAERRRQSIRDDFKSPRDRFCRVQFSRPFSGRRNCVDIDWSVVIANVPSRGVGHNIVYFCLTLFTRFCELYNFHSKSYSSSARLRGIPLLWFRAVRASQNDVSIVEIIPLIGKNSQEFLIEDSS